MLKVVAFIVMLIAQNSHANLVGVDSRRPITDQEKLIALDLTSQDADRIRQATGYVYCPGTVNGNPSQSSGALVAENDILVTNAHAFVDKKGRLREPLEQCQFINQVEKPESSFLQFTEGNFELMRDYGNHKGSDDYAVVRLKRKIPGARAFPIVESGAPLVRGSSFVMVSAAQSNPAPLIQSCQIKKIEKPIVSYNTTFLGDCDVVPGSSGSVNLIRVNGELAAIAVVAGGGGQEKNGLEYSVEDQSYSFHVTFRDAFLSAILRLKRMSL